MHVEYEVEIERLLTREEFEALGRKEDQPPQFNTQNIGRSFMQGSNQGWPVGSMVLDYDWEVTGLVSVIKIWSGRHF